MISRVDEAPDDTALSRAESKAKGSVLHRAITHERVAELANELYLARGGGDGQDLEDWLEAEKFLQHRDNPLQVHALLVD